MTQYIGRVPYGWLRHELYPSPLRGAPQVWTHPSFYKSVRPYQHAAGNRVPSYPYYRVSGDLVPDLCAIPVKPIDIPGIPPILPVPCTITMADLQKGKDALKNAINQSDGVSKTCTTLTDQEKSGWEDYKNRFNDFYNNSPSITERLNPLHMRGEYDKAQAFERELPNWQNIFKTKCGLPGPVVVPTPAGPPPLIPPGILNPIEGAAKAVGTNIAIGAGVAALIAVLVLSKK